MSFEEKDQATRDDFQDKQEDEELGEYFDILNSMEEGKENTHVADIYDYDEAYGDMVADQEEAITDAEGS